MAALVLKKHFYKPNKLYTGVHAAGLGPVYLRRGVQSRRLRIAAGSFELLGVAESVHR